MLILKNKAFNKWALEQGVDDKALITVAEDMEQGLFDANLGGDVYKKRIPIAGRGKRGGARVIIAFKLHKTVVFMYGFSKNQKENVTIKEKEGLKALAKVYLMYTRAQLKEAIDAGQLIEVI